MMAFLNAVWDPGIEKWTLEGKLINSNTFSTLVNSSVPKLIS